MGGGKDDRGAALVDCDPVTVKVCKKRMKWNPTGELVNDDEGLEIVTVPVGDVGSGRTETEDLPTIASGESQCFCAGSMGLADAGGADEQRHGGRLSDKVFPVSPK